MREVFEFVGGPVADTLGHLALMFIGLRILFYGMRGLWRPSTPQPATDFARGSKND